MRRSTGPAILAAAFALASGWGLSCVFDLPPVGGDGGDGGAATGSATGTATGVGASGGGTAGTGGTSAGGHTGTGGADPPCDPPPQPGACSPGLDVDPTVVATIGSAMINGSSRPHLAWGGSVYGVYTRVDQHADSGRDRFFTMSRAGAMMSGQIGPFQHSVNAEASLGVVEGHFTVGTLPVFPAPTHVLRFDQCGQQLGSIVASPDTSFLGQDIIVGGNQSNWLLAGISGNRIAYGVAPDAPGSVAITQTDLEAVCCSDATYAVGNAFDRFWLAGRLGAEVRLASVEPGGAIDYGTSLSGLEGAPRFVGAYGDSLVVTTTSHVALIDPGGSSLEANHAYQNGNSCIFAVVGTRLKRACLITSTPPSYISVGDFDPLTGVSTPQHQLRIVEAESAPGLAWDGQGWGITWYEAAGVVYAHLCEP